MGNGEAMDGFLQPAAYVDGGAESVVAFARQAPGITRIARS